MKNSSKQQIRGAMYSSIRAYNCHLPMEVLVKMDLITLLRNCHPIERTEYARQLHKEGFISEGELKNIITPPPYVLRKSKDELYGYRREEGQ